MDIKEAREKLCITDEEKAALMRYQSFWHTGINLLANMSPYVYKNLRKQGWFLPENEEQVKEALEDFVKIYSAMYKESCEMNSTMMVVRGTGKTDVNRLYEKTNQFFSTTTSEEIAKTFTHYGDDAILRIGIKEGTPHIDMYQYLNEGSRDEQEILIAPFCKIDKKEFVSDWAGYSYYNLTLSKPELQEKSKEELSNLEEKIISGFNENIKNMNEYIKYREKSEVLFETYKREQDKDEKKYLRKSMDESEELAHTYSKLTDEYKNDLRTYLEGRCKEKELEIDQALEVIKEERKREEQERIKEEKIKQEEKIKNETTEKLSNSIEKSSKSSESIDENLNKLYKDLMDKNAGFEKVADLLKIPYHSGNGLSRIPEKITNIEKVMEYVNKKVEEDRINAEKEDLEIESLKEKLEKVTQYNDNFEYGNEIFSNISDLGKEFASETQLEIKGEILKKAQALIKNAKISQYNMQYQELENMKIGFFGKLFGKENLRQEQMKNIKLRIDSENIEIENIPEETNNFSIRDTLAKLYIAKNYEVGNEYNSEIVEYYSAIKDVFGTENGRFSEEEIAQIANQKLSENKSILPIKYGEKISTKKQTQDLQLQNENLEKLNDEKRIKSKDNLKKTLQTRKKDHITLILNELDNIEGVLENNEYYDLEDKEIKVEKAIKGKGKYEDTLELFPSI